MIDTVATFQCPLHGVDIPDIPDSYLYRQAVQIFHVAGPETPMSRPGKTLLRPLFAQPPTLPIPSPPWSGPHRPKELRSYRDECSWHVHFKVRKMMAHRLKNRGEPPILNLRSSLLNTLAIIVEGYLQFTNFMAHFTSTQYHFLGKVHQP